MKKVLLLSLVTCIALLILCSCGKQIAVKSSIYSKEYSKSEDYDITQYSWGTPGSAAETESQIFFAAGAYLFCMDKSSREVYPLCFRTECAHIEEKDSYMKPKCDAYIGHYYAGFVGVYRNKLYIVCVNKQKGGKDYDLLEMNLDGSEKKVILESLNEAGFSFWSDIVLHRGVLYYITSSHNLEGQAQNEIHGISLTSKNKTPVTVYSSENSLGMMLPYLNGLYFSEEEPTASEEDIPGNHILMYDIQSGKVSDVFPDAKDTGFSAYGVEAGKLVFNKDGELVLFDPETKAVEKETGPLLHFREEHSDWHANAECILDDFMMFTCFDRKNSDFIYDLIVCDGAGNEVCALKDEAWFAVKGGKMVTIDNEDYYLKFSASQEPFSVKLYKKSDLLKGTVAPESVLEVDSLQELNPGVNYITE